MVKDMRNGETTEPALNEKNAISISEALNMLDDTMISEIRRILEFLARRGVVIKPGTLEEYEEMFAIRTNIKKPKLEFAKFYSTHHSSNNPISDNYFEQLRKCLHQLEEIVKKLQ